MPSLIRCCLVLTAAFSAHFGFAVPAKAAQPVRAGAALSLSFNQSAGNAALNVAGIAESFEAQLINQPERVQSPFWGRTGKTALRLDASRRQFVRLDDVPYLDRPDALTVSLFFLSLDPAAGETVHGILAKRSDGKRGTNYGINYVLGRDDLQVYVNDGQGFHIAHFRARAILGGRRMVHLSATFEVGDAPPPDTDTKRDDLRIRLFVNGEQVPPKSVDGGQINGPDAWLTNLRVPALLNDAPLTLGSSTASIEHASCVIDDFLLFARALSPAEAHQLFLESAGPNAPQLARLQLLDKPLPPLPAIESISQLGLQIGQTTQLTIEGSNLAGDPHVELPIPGVKQTIAKRSSRSRLVVDLTVPSDVPPGIYPLSVCTAAGISKPVGIAVDGLSEMLVGDSAPDRPSALPAAFSGLLSAAGQSRVYFNGKAGAHVVAEVEAKRIGSGMDPVLEVKSATGNPLAIEWGKDYLRGDARAEVTLPADGMYLVELHDLAYKAPNDSPFRLLVGDFRAVDVYFPPVVERGRESIVEPIGTGIPAGVTVAANMKDDPTGLAKFLVVPPELHASGPLPPIRISDGWEIQQVAQPGHQLQMIDARFADKTPSSVAVSGRLSKPREVDRYLLAVTPGSTLSLSVDGRSLNSPVDGEISILSHPDGKLLASDGGRPGAAAKGIQYRVPTGVSNIQVAVRDLVNGGGPHFVYRLRIAPAAAPDFRLALLDSRLNIPQNGRAVAELQVDRAGYAGPIDLAVEGDEHVAIAPKQLPAEGGSRKVLVTFARTGDQPLAAVERLRIVGRSVGLTPSLRRVATVVVPNEAQLAGFLDSIPTASRGITPASLDLAAMPHLLLKGVDTEWPVIATAAGTETGRWLRLSLVSTESPRAAEGNRRRRRMSSITAAAEQALSTARGKGNLRVSVPIEIAQPMIDFAIKADVVSHPYSGRVIATTYSRPFRALVQDPVGIQLDSGSLNLVAGTVGKIRGKLVRNPAFKQPVMMTLTGLPAGYLAQPVSVGGDKAEFEIPVTTAKEAPPRTVPNLAITVTLSDGKVPIKQAIELKVAPPPAAKPAAPTPSKKK